MQTVLAKIVADKAIWVEARKQQQPLASFQNEIQPSTRHFYDALQGARTAFILECKKASPSKGVIRMISIRHALLPFINITLRQFQC